MSRGIATEGEMVDEVLEMHGAGMSIEGIHSETGLPVPTIYRLVRENELRDLDGAELAPSVQAAIIEDYLAHKPFEEACKARNVAMSTAFALLRKAGIDARSRRRGSESVAARRDNAVRLYQENAGVLDILATTGISSTSLYKELRKRQIPLRNQYER